MSQPQESVIDRMKNMYFGWWTVIAGAIISLWGYSFLDEKHRRWIGRTYWRVAY